MITQIKTWYCIMSIISPHLLSKTNSLFIQDPYNVLVSDNADYKIEEPIKENEYELIENEKSYKSTGNALNRQKNKEHSKLPTSLHTNTNAKKENISDSRRPVAGITDYPPLTTVAQSNYGNHKRPMKYIYINNGTDYNIISYDALTKEQISKTKYGKKQNMSKTCPTGVSIRHTIKSIFSFDTHCKNCTAVELKDIGFKAIYCLMFDYERGETPQVLAARFWRIVKIWMLVYLCVALPLWCMKGWCCCCLCCKFFKPRQTIEEAKRYFLVNPPGVLRVHSKQIQYEPTEKERDAYEEFEHLLRTI